MAIEYERVNWDTTKYVKPTNMNQMDAGIKAACDGVDENSSAITAINSTLGNKSEASAVSGNTAFAKINSLNDTIPKILIDVFERVEITNKYPNGRYLSILAFVDRSKASGLLSNVTQLQINFTNANITLEYCDLQGTWHTVWNK